MQKACCDDEFTSVTFVILCNIIYMTNNILELLNLFTLKANWDGYSSEQAKQKKNNRKISLKNIWWCPSSDTEMKFFAPASSNSFSFLAVYSFKSIWILKFIKCRDANNNNKQIYQIGRRLSILYKLRTPWALLDMNHDCCLCTEVLVIFYKHVDKRFISAD